MNEKTKDVLRCICAIALCVAACEAGAFLFAGVEDAFLSPVLKESVFAAAALVSVVCLKKTEIFRSDVHLLEEEWGSALFMIVLIIWQIVRAVGMRSSFTVDAAGFVLFVLQMLLIGFCEETLFRGILQRSFHAFFGEDTAVHVFAAVVCAGVLFGALHLLNGLHPKIGFRVAASQAAVVCGLGIYLGAVYYRTGKCLWYLIAMHALYDGAATVVGGRLSGTDTASIIGQTGSISDPGLVLFGFLFYLLISLFLLRKRKVEPLLKKGGF